MKNYLLRYTVYDRQGAVVKTGKIIAKRRLSELDAKIRLEAYLKGKHPSFGSLVVHSCIEHNPFLEMFGDIFNQTKH